MHVVEVFLLPFFQFSISSIWSILPPERAWLPWEKILMTACIQCHTLSMNLIVSSSPHPLRTHSSMPYLIHIFSFWLFNFSSQHLLTAGTSSDTSNHLNGHTNGYANGHASTSKLNGIHTAENGKNGLRSRTVAPQWWHYT